jgi:hypothetical protein
VIAHQNYGFVGNERTLVLKKRALEINAIKGRKYEPKYAVYHAAKMDKNT